jgi:hypothetical protein
LKNRYVIPGAILLILALLVSTYFSAYLAQGLNYVGVSNQSPQKEFNQFVHASAGQCSNVPFNLTTTDVMTASVQSNPGGIDVLIMNQGNFTSFEAGNCTGSTGVYPESRFNVTAYTFSFNETEGSGQYHLVFVVPHSASSADILVHMSIVRTVTTVEESYLPYFLAVIGIILIGIGMISFPKRAPPPPRAPPAQQRPQAPYPAAAPAQVKCRYCGAALSPGQAFCPSCNRSQT